MIEGLAEGLDKIANRVDLFATAVFGTPRDPRGAFVKLTLEELPELFKATYNENRAAQIAEAADCFIIWLDLVHIRLGISPLELLSQVDATLGKLEKSKYAMDVMGKMRRIKE